MRAAILSLLLAGCAADTGAQCNTAADCGGALPDICLQCSDGTTQCAHHVCDQGQCTIAICPTSGGIGHLDAAADSGAPHR
jgi:hypothetical protein